MRWGESTEQRAAREHARHVESQTYYANWRSWFAWRPVALEDGTRAWLETVACRSPGTALSFFPGRRRIWCYKPWVDHVKAMMTGAYDSEWGAAPAGQSPATSTTAYKAPMPGARTRYKSPY